MELLQLTYFCDAAVTQNFSRTAKRFSVPPSNISQSIKRLEEELGAPLFFRTANRVTLNDRGESFYREVSEALGMIRHAANLAGGVEEDRVLRLGIRISRRITMQAVAAFQSRYPGVNIVAEHGDHTQNDDFDIIISDAAFAHPEFVKSRAFREQVLLAARKDLLPNGRPLCAADIMDKPFITMSESYSMYALTQEICRDLEFRPRIALQGEDPVYVRRCVALGLGIAFAPAVSWRGQFPDEVTLHPIGQYSRDICIYRRKTAHAPEYVQDFYDILVREFEREMTET